MSGITPEPRRANAEHEAWHCAALIEEGIPVGRVVAWPWGGTFWGPPEDEHIEAVITMLPALIGHV